MQCYAVLQGMLGRSDWQAAARVPIALLPAGSGNALSANTGMWDLPTALHAVIKAGITAAHKGK
jgi:diacylglycerol kinase family enzyme